MKIQTLGQVSYLETLKAMQSFTSTRTVHTEDEIWILEHPPVFTLGRHADPAHLLNPDSNIPVINTDRGGQITYHGPGQLIIYFLLDLKKSKTGPKDLVCKIENILISLLADYKIPAEKHAGAPGIYIKNKKIASLGLRITKGYCYHGLSLNINMDLSPFLLINPCGYKNLEITQMSEYVSEPTIKSLDFLEIGNQYADKYCQASTTSLELRNTEILNSRK